MGIALLVRLTLELQGPFSHGWLHVFKENLEFFLLLLIFFVFFVSPYFWQQKQMVRLASYIFFCFLELRGPLIKYSVFISSSRRKKLECSVLLVKIACLKKIVKSSDTAHDESCQNETNFWGSCYSQQPSHGMFVI